jgi:methylated-DNA-[protein]-cysteine S-methyltransferase
MHTAGLHCFDTALGPCGVAWGPQGLRAVALPEATPDAVVARLQARAPGAVVTEAPPWVLDLADRLRRHLAGEAVDYTDVPLDLSDVPAFHRDVYAAARALPSGQTVSYGALAAQLGRPGAARAVGQAMARNPWLLVVPCHRVLAADGGAGGFSAHGGVATKGRLLALEGAPLKPARTPRASRHAVA